MEEMYMKVLHRNLSTADIIVIPYCQGVLNLKKIQHQNGRSYTVGDGIPRLGHNQPQTALAFGQAEPPLYFHPLIFFREILHLVADLIFLWPAQYWASQTNAMFLTIAKVFPRINRSAMVCRFPPSL